MMLKQASNDLDDEDGVYLRYRLNSRLFSLWRLQAHTKTQDWLLMDLLFADDADIVANTEQAWCTGSTPLRKDTGVFESFGRFVIVLLD